MKRQRSSWHRRLTLGVAALAAAGAGLTGGTVAGQVSASDSVDTQALADGSVFPGLRGTEYAGTAAGAAAGGTEDLASKPAIEASAPSANHAPDVPGQAGAAAADQTADATAQIGDLNAATGTPAAVQAALDASGSARVIVTMKVPVATEASLSAAGVSSQRAAIGAALDDLAGTLAGTGSQLHSKFQVTPAAVYTVDQAGFDALLADSSVAAVTLDGEGTLALDVSTGIIDSDLLNSAGVNGDNWNGTSYEVAILDSGVDNQHNAFTGRIVSQACYSAGNDCPGGVSSSTAAGSGDNCTFSTDCQHGTHVGGIAAGALYSGGHEGVAGGANIVAIQVGHDSCGGTCWRYFFSDLDLALQRVLDLKNGGRNIVAVNMSLGGPLYSPGGQCSTDFPNTQTLAANLQAAGVAFVVASGNDGSNSQVTYPSCLNSAYSVGATDDSDVVAGFSNTSSKVNWFAPGVGIEAPIPTGDSHDDKSGTSMATPHVTGAFALLRECVDGNGIPITSAAAAARLTATGPNVTDAAAGITRKRINVLDAATGTVNNNDFANAETLSGVSPFNDFDFNVCADGEAGEPGPGSIENSIWWNWTPSTTGVATVSTEDNGTNVTTFDTVLTVFTGNSLGSLVVHAHDDDGGTGSRSLTRFLVQAGTTYRIRVDGFGGSNGLLNLHTQVDPALCGGAAATIVGTELATTINGTAGNDVIVAGGGNDTINAGGGDDRICGDAGNDRIAAGTGDDFVLGGPGADTIIGAAGNDTLVGNAGGGSTDDLGDIISAGPGNDFVDGWVGDDELNGGPGNDQLRGEAGIDLVRYTLSPNGVIASLATNTATGYGNDTFVEVENLVGSNHADRLIGDGGPNVIIGSKRNDVIRGGGGADVLDGNRGNDRIQGNEGNDSIRGHTGNDTLVGYGGDDVIIGSAGADVLRGGVGTDDCNGGSGADIGTGCEVTAGLP